MIQQATIVWRCPVPAKVFHAFEVGARLNRGQSYRSLCGRAELRHLRKKYREPEILARCPECAALKSNS